MTELTLLPDDVEQDLRASVRKALEKHSPTERLNAIYDGTDEVSGPLWSAFVELGLPGLLVPESLGGAGATAVEAAAVLEEVGRAAAPSPYLTSSVVATTALVALGDTTILPLLASGEQTAALLVRPTALRHGPAALTTVGLPADVLLLPEGNALYAVRGATTTPISSLDMTRPLGEVDLAGSERTLVSDDAAAAIDRALLTGAGLLAAEQVGLARWSLETTIEYLQERRQFGRVVGGFQALKHRLADLYAAVEQADAAARYAAATLAADDPDAPVAVAVAASFCSEAAVHAAEEAVQLHGGLGMTWEHPAHLHLKRAKADQLLLGTPESHRQALAGLVDLPA
ncbi:MULTISPECIES: acyl-CoA dehydrogenase family protein [unclassified Nocardioides]|uniref:acyl-CoA dehydrogenase family protein n=1 Tax=unclassified Nocardioides TaxID=2615069 RepID=UPI0009F12BF0|nr:MULTISPECIES: acyl-CoA dehydrogenase family protein [unclassified Nocardioides]GAW52064.1 Putative Acyl-CoA dehydrogenase [Nocardioides sp. PD653-B2]GAW57205.1 putative Acyl-CoA dehydrogenase [Nocardioides sp. PD653]